MENGSFTEDLKVQLPKGLSGVWYFHLSAQDKAGNISPEAAHYPLKLDLVKPLPPQVSSSTHVDFDRWYPANKIQIQLTAASKLSGMEAFYYVFDRNPQTIPQPDQDPRTVEPAITVRAEEPGVWHFHAVVKDQAGNLSEPTHFTVQVAGGELPPPLVSSPTHPQEEEPMTHHDPLFTWEERFEGNFKIAGYIYKLSPDPEEKLSEQDSFTNDKVVQLKDVAEGIWYFHVAAVGKNGKPSPLASRRMVIIRRVGEISGTFFQKDGISPLSGVKVEIGRGEKAVATALTDARGRFRFGGIPEGKYEILLQGPQFPLLRLKDIAVSAGEGSFPLVFTEDIGIFPTPSQPGPVRFYYFIK
jgi:hypothetical protein